MIDRLIRMSIEQRWIVMFLVLIAIGLGIWNYQRLPIDAVPDITNVQVQINTEAPGYAPLEAEQRITFAVETAMAGLPELDYTRSLSRYGLSQVTVVFKDGTDIYFARNLVAQRLQEARSLLPEGIEPQRYEVVVGLLTGEKIKQASGRRYLRARRPELYGKMVEPHPEGTEALTKPGWGLAFEEEGDGAEARGETRRGS